MTVTIYQGDCREVLRGLPAESVHMCVTSPPFWGLRDYGLPPLVWGGDGKCSHTWGDESIKSVQPRPDHSGLKILDTRGNQPSTRARGMKASQGQFCQLCNAWRGSLGLEPTPDLYVAHLVEVFQEVKRVLRKDGVAWLNLGSSYAGSGAGGGGNRKGNEHGQHDAMAIIGRPKVPSNFKPKDLTPIPWLVALALQQGSWWLRSDIIWAKGVSGQKETETQIISAIHESFSPKMAAFVESKLMENLDLFVGGCMPESVRDRPTSSHEYVFLLTKSKRYFYDKWAIVEPSVTRPQNRLTPRDRHPKGDAGRQPHTKPAYKDRHEFSGRNRRTVWQINTKPFKGAHFAVFPPDLIRPMVLAGTSEEGCCVECGAPWKRVISKGLTAHDGETASIYEKSSTANRLALLRQAARERGGEYANETQTVGWEPACKCDCPDAIPAIVLDPFFGAGTTGLVADELGRDCVGIELNPEYVEMARERIGGNVIMMDKEKK